MLLTKARGNRQKLSKRFQMINRSLREIKTVKVGGYMEIDLANCAVSYFL